MATEVGTAYVAIIPSAKGFAKALQRDIAKEFSGSGLDKLISDALGETRIKLRVTPELDVNALSTSAISQQKARLPVEVDRSQAAAEVRAAARAAEDSAPQVKLRVDVDGNRLRSLLSGALDLATDVIGNFVRNANVAFGSMATNLASSVTTLVTTGSATTVATGGLNLLVGALLAVASAAVVAATGFVALAPVVLLAGGAFGAATTAAVGLAGTVGVLKLGFGGIFDAFKDTAKGAGSAGRSVADSARQIAAAQRGIIAAERGLTAAQRDSRRAQEELTRARKTAIERIEDLGRALRGARLDEREATLRVRDAQKDLEQARRSGNLNDIEKAQLAYEQSVLALENAKDATADLTVEQESAAKAGVEGSDEVRAAMERQQSATDSLASATESLTAAHESLAAARQKPDTGGGGIVQDVIKLAPAAQQFVDAIKALKPAFESLRLHVQQRLFAGIGTAVERLGKTWLPQLKLMLGDLADRFNNFAKGVIAALGKPDFIANIRTAMGGFGNFVDRIGESMEPLIDAFGRLAKASLPFLEELGDMIGGVIEKFSAWIKTADETGKLDQFMMDAAKALRDIWDIGGLVVGISKEIIEIFFPSSKRASDGFLGGVKALLQEIKDWLADPENKQKIQDWIDKFQDAVDTIVTKWIPKISEWIGKIDGWITKFDKWTTAIGSWKGALTIALTGLGGPIGVAIGAFQRLNDGATRHFGGVAAAARGLPALILAAFSPLGGQLYRAGQNIIQGLIDGMNSMGRSIGLAAGNAAARIASYFPRSPAKQGPLSGRGSPYYSGQTIVGMLADGVRSQLGVAGSAAGDVAGQFAFAGASVGAASVASLRGLSAATPPPAPLIAQWVGGDGDPIVRAIRENTRIYYGGSAQAAFGSGSQ